LPRGVIEATAIGALALARTGDLPRALVLARRAALMARSEGRPQQEFLTAVVLARVRRHAGRPHLAVRVLTALAGSATIRWRGWVAWELLLAQGETAGVVGAAGRAGDAAAALGGALAAAQHGDRAAFGAHADTVLRTLAGCALLRDEAEVALAALDHARPAPAVLLGWCRGDTAPFPSPLHGLGTIDPTRPAGATSRALAVAPAGVAGRRVLPIGVGLFAGEFPRAARLPAAGAPAAGEGGGEDEGQDRTLAGIAALALAGPDGLTTGEFFARVYGFPLVAERHDGALRVLLHRMRKAVGDAGEIDSDAGQMALRANVPLVVPDPRCAEPAEARVVAYLAFTGAASTELAAERLHLPVRTTRAILQKLVAAGVCRAVREGRRVRYEVDDSIITRLTPITGLD
jgi:hypothetical protein